MAALFWSLTLMMSAFGPGHAVEVMRRNVESDGAVNTSPRSTNSERARRGGRHTAGFASTKKASWATTLVSATFPFQGELSLLAMESTHEFFCLQAPTALLAATTDTNNDETHLHEMKTTLRNGENMMFASESGASLDPGMYCCRGVPPLNGGEEDIGDERPADSEIGDEEITSCEGVTNDALVAIPDMLIDATLAATPDRNAAVAQIARFAQDSKNNVMIILEDKDIHDKVHAAISEQHRGKVLLRTKDSWGGFFKAVASAGTWTRGAVADTKAFGKGAVAATKAFGKDFGNAWNRR